MSQNRGRRIRGVISLGTGVAVVVALGASLLYFLWVASIRNADQIGQLSIGTLVVGIACAFAALMLALFALMVVGTTTLTFVASRDTSTAIASNARSIAASARSRSTPATPIRTRVPSHGRTNSSQPSRPAR